jgi:hypothetical protein
LSNELLAKELTAFLKPLRPIVPNSPGLHFHKIGRAPPHAFRNGTPFDKCGLAEPAIPIDSLVDCRPTPYIASKEMAYLLELPATRLMMPTESDLIAREDCW